MYLTKLVKDGMIVLKRMDVPLYSSKFSKKTYTIHQHLLCLCIKEIQKQSYRDCRDFLDEFEFLQKALGLTQVPHYTTPQKCLQRFPPKWYKMLLKKLTCLIKSRASAVIDGTGMMQTQASFSYIKRIGRKIRKRDYFKVIIIVDPIDGFILTAWGIHGNRHESPWFIPLLKDVPFPLDDICSDKGFDSEKNQRYVRMERKARSFVDVRGTPKRGRYRKQVYRRKQRDPDHWKQRYRQMRNCIESKNSSVKHRFGDFIPGKNIHNRRRYFFIRVFTANLITIQKSRNPLFLICFIIEDFYDPFTWTL
jgi:transposase